MSDDDDDLPVLTQVLRTGARQVSAPLSRSPDDLLADELDLSAFEGMGTESIIIGHDPSDGEIRALDPATIDGLASNDPTMAESASEIVADPRQPLGADAFRLNQDLDGTLAASEPPIDEPHLVPSAPLEQDSQQGLDTPIVFEAPDLEALSLRLRDAVLADLSTRIDTELDARIAQVMHAELEAALAHLQGNLRAHLTDALRDVVARAVDEQIARGAWSAEKPRID